MGSCSACREFLQLSLTTIWDRDEKKARSLYTIKRVCNLYERRGIRESAQDCQLCRKIYDCLQDIYGPEFDVPDEDSENGHFIQMMMVPSNLDGDENLISSIRLCCNPHITVRQFFPPDVHFAAWADRGTPASQRFVSWPPILHGSPEETAEFVQKLLQNCQDHHGVCRLRELESEFDLPSRVLSITDGVGGISVKLVEGQGLRGRYCALSHCWGPKDKRPLRTTNKNLTDHLASISWEDLTPLFCDAITLTRNIGIKYLWIDSLCIVQDDKQDWLNESKKMASIYRRATLVIAAADSEDSTQRLSNAQRPEPLTLRIPYYTQEGSAQGSYNIAPCLYLGHSVDGPLRERGWVLQELYLGRRKIFFTTHGLSWKCGQCEVVERAQDADLQLYETSKWTFCLESYSAMRLTFPTDRIIALLGIVAHLGESRNDRFVPEAGVWEDQLAEQLLWRPLQTTNEDLPDLPSWCWAATGGPKCWPISVDPVEVILNGAIQTVKLKESRSLGASGLLIKTKIAPLPLRNCCAQSFPTVDKFKPGFCPPEACILPRWATEHDNIKRFPILNQNGTRNILGLALFDRGIEFSECFCFILARSLKTPNNICRGSDKTSSSGAETSVVEVSEDGCPGPVHRDTDDCVDIVEVGRSTEVYWALLLQPVDETLKKFTRVGMALLWPRALETGRGEYKEFEIV